MLKSIEHRGYDDEGVWSSAPVDEEGRRACLAHRRLAIIDTSSAGHQPMLSADGRFAVTFNGEIYNYRELHRRLEGSGHEFRTDTDTEVMLEAFAEWGVEGALQHLNGMFAFAVWDGRERTLTLAHDPEGGFLARCGAACMPAVYVVDRDGVVRFTEAGYALDRVAAIERAAEAVAAPAASK